MQIVTNLPTLSDHIAAHAASVLAGLLISNWVLLLGVAVACAVARARS